MFISYKIKTVVIAVVYSNRKLVLFFSLLNVDYCCHFCNVRKFFFIYSEYKLCNICMKEGDHGHDILYFSSHVYCIIFMWQLIIFWNLLMADLYIISSKVPACTCCKVVSYTSNNKIVFRVCIFHTKLYAYAKWVLI